MIEEYYPEKGYSSNCLTLTPESLEIKHQGHRYVLPFNTIADIQLTHIKLLFYYLAGGFTFTLSLMAVLGNLLAPLPGIFLVILGATLFFIGWRGKISLQISTTSNDYVFWFSGSYAPFLNFINLARHRIITYQSVESEPPESSNASPNFE
ncbi:hypothetical protein HUW51_01675 [Adhaeribacter swui]|uniref:Uncharacterized protein n=1 Tax=Adhaeribacter swui TaxID=2086471 RepID=A0A7G7G2W1_9BACT|nr:hypothetical protein [Adhaeribacter swui]QNF31495.1 hypothetical protein HUW51_01675 [Adhaeribacter swui]